AMGFRDAPMRGVFQEVTPPEKLVFTNNAVDADDNIVLDGLTTVRFEDIGNGKTRMHFHTRAQGTLPQVVFMLQGMEAGWTQSFDKMDAMFAGKA
ncbi:MAG TPA: SRPBCC domain-containing protein, partial [Rhizomicrobium sp.]|nr:SRPBCC domain-containing protein [Rhizomicrobium sp.]